MEWSLTRAAPAIRNQNPPNSKLQMSAFTELAGLSANVDRVVHMPQLEAPPDRPHPFVYFITIRNDSGGEWWEGELNGKVGLLPANYVELLK